MLERFLEEGMIRVDNLANIGATSIDVRIGRLYRNRIGAYAETGDETFEDLYEEFEPASGKWLLSSDRAYIAESVETIYKPDWKWGILNSISSWARYSVRCRGLDRSFLDPGKEYEGKLRILFKPCGPSVILRPGDAPCQVRLAGTGDETLLDSQIKQIKDYKQTVPGAELRNWVLHLHWTI